MGLFFYNKNFPSQPLIVVLMVEIQGPSKSWTQQDHCSMARKEIAWNCLSCSQTCKDDPVKIIV